MKKIILIFSLVLVVAIGAGLYYVYTNLDAIVKAAIEKAGSQTTQTAVRVDSVKIDLSQAAGTIKGLSIDNPKGFETRHALVLDAIEAQINLKSLTQEPYIIDKVIIREPKLFYEMNEDLQGNLNVLYNNITAATAGDGKDKAAAKDKEPKLIIRHFVFADASVNATVSPLNEKKVTLKLSTIEMRDLGGKNGGTPTEISQQVLRTLTERALAEVKRAGIGTIKSEAQEKLDTKKQELEDKAGEKLKKLLGK